MKVCLLLLPLALCAAGAAPGPVRLNRLIELFAKGATPFGTFVFDPSVRSAAALPPSLDFVILDMEHTPWDMTRLESYLLAMTNKQRILQKGNLQMDTVPIVRLPANGRERSEFLVKQVLDLGAFGVVIPHVDTADEALAAVRAMRYPQRLGAPDFEPRGHRGVSYGWAARYWGLPGLDYAARADLWPLDPGGELLFWPMIESAEAVGNIRAILKTPGISGVFVGPADLSFSLGVPQNDPRVEQAIAAVAAACKETGVPCGTLTSDGGVAARLEQGFRFLAVSGDVARALEIGRARRP